MLFPSIREALEEQLQGVTERKLSEVTHWQKYDLHKSVWSIVNEKNLAGNYLPFSEFGGLFLGDFAKLLIATMSFVMSVRRSVCRHGTHRLPSDRFS